MANCRSCDAEVIWIKLRPKMKSHPVNATPSKVIVLIPSGGTQTVGKTVDGYVSHFATCPQAAEWRNR